MQTTQLGNFIIPTCLGNLWKGQKTFTINRALREAAITVKEFETCWQNKVRSAIKTKRGKKQLVKLLKKGGFDLCNHGDQKSNLMQRVWFINQVVGRGAPYPVPVTASSSAQIYACTCMYVCMYYVYSDR